MKMVNKKQKENRYKGWLGDWLMMWFYFTCYIGFALFGFTIIIFYDYIFGLILMFLSGIAFISYSVISIVMRNNIINKKIDIILKKLEMKK